MRRAALALLLALAAPAAVAQTAPRSHVLADGAVLVANGERVVLRLSADGAPTLVSAVSAAAEDAAPPKPRSGANPIADADGVITLVLGEQDGKTLLKVRSGLSKAFDYDADLVVAASAGKLRAQPTSVCTVLPLLSAYEMWPERVTGVLVKNFRLRDTNAVDCPAPKRPARSLTPA